MKLINKESILAGLISRWKAQYPQRKVLYDGTVTTRIAAQLEAENPLTEIRANEIIGNDTWTVIECHECGEHVTAVVQLGQEPDYESATASICLSCLKKAIKLIEP